MLQKKKATVWLTFLVLLLASCKKEMAVEENPLTNNDGQKVKAWLEKQDASPLLSRVSMATAILANGECLWERTIYSDEGYITPI